MRIGSLFSGIGGLELGLECSGLGHTVWQVERDEYCRRVLERHWPNVARFDDVREVGGTTLAPVDLICGGFPCQDVSSAGKGAGLTGERSGLWREYARIVGELRPEWVVVENVLSGASRWLDAVVCELEQLGYAAFPVPISAADVGAPHLRKRIFIIAHATNTNSLRELQSQRSIGDERGWVSHRGWWSAEPCVGRVAHGVSARSHRLRALGNAVVPPCAEVIGWIIREMSESGGVEREH